MNRENNCLKTSDWMQKLEHDTPIWKLCIPGTHNTMTYEGSLLPHAKCQTMTLSDQLLGGIRFIDIRFKYNASSQRYDIFHGICSVEKSLNDHVMKVVESFLKQHQYECIFMRLKDEDGKGPKDFADLFVSKWSDILWCNVLTDEYPTLGDVRGKVILLKEFEETSESRNYGYNFRDQNIADDWNLALRPAGYEEKMNGIKSNIKALQHMILIETVTTTKLFLSFLSGNSVTNTPFDVATEMNSRFEMYLKNEGSNIDSVGSVLMDFPSSELIAHVININKFSLDPNESQCNVIKRFQRDVHQLYHSSNPMEDIIISWGETKTKISIGVKTGCKQEMEDCLKINYRVMWESGIVEIQEVSQDVKIKFSAHSDYSVYWVHAVTGVESEKTGSVARQLLIKEKDPDYANTVVHHTGITSGKVIGRIVYTTFNYKYKATDINDLLIIVPESEEGQSPETQHFARNGDSGCFITGDCTCAFGILSCTMSNYSIIGEDGRPVKYGALGLACKMTNCIKAIKSKYPAIIFNHNQPQSAVT